VSLVADVEVRLDRFHEDVHLDVADGKVVAVLGPNGSGKTTLLRALAGVVPLSGGRIVLDGHAVPQVDDLASLPMSLWAQRQGYAPIHPNILGF